MPPIVVSSGPTGPSDWLPVQSETADSSPRSAAPQTAQAVPVGLPPEAVAATVTVPAETSASVMTTVRVSRGRRNEPSPGSTRRFMCAASRCWSPVVFQPMPKEPTPPAPPVPLDMMIWIGYQPVDSFTTFLAALSP